MEKSSVLVAWLGRASRNLSVNISIAIWRHESALDIPIAAWEQTGRTAVRWRYENGKEAWEETEPYRYKKNR